MSAAQILWDNWSKYDDLDSVFREGFLKVKAYGFGEEARWAYEAYHVESTLIHSGRSAMLFSDMMDLWPAYFEEVDKYAALKVALIHDIGELVVGDVCDDGRKAHEEKRGPEWDAVIEHYFPLSEEKYFLYKGIHWQFEEAKTFLGQAIKLADKLDFLAKLIKIESQGYKLNSKKYLSPSDLILAKEIDCYDFVDIVANHLRHMMKDYRFDKRLVVIATSFMTCGLSTIDRPFFEWWPLKEPSKCQPKKQAKK